MPLRPKAPLYRLRSAPRTIVQRIPDSYLFRLVWSGTMEDSGADNDQGQPRAR